MQKPTLCREGEGRRKQPQSPRVRRTAKHRKRRVVSSADGRVTARSEEESHATREACVVLARDAQPDARAGQAGPGEVAGRSVVPLKPGNAGGGKGPWFKAGVRRGKGPGNWWRHL